MQEYIQLFQFFTTQSDDSTKTARIIESLYFRHIASNSYQPFRNCEEYQLARDIVKLESKLAMSKSLGAMNIESETLKCEDWYHQHSDGKTLDDAQIKNILQSLKKKHRHVVTAVFFADLIRVERNKEWFKYAVTVLLSVIVAILAFIAKD